jgi:hypothetical protein
MSVCLYACAGAMHGRLADQLSQTRRLLVSAKLCHQEAAASCAEGGPGLLLINGELGQLRGKLGRPGQVV